jgi:hypothetical protein
MSEQKLTDADEALVAKLRAMPGEGTEPDWNQLAQRIHAALPAEVHRPWWRTLLQPRWLAPILAGAVGIGAFAVILHSGSGEQPAPIAVMHDAPHDASVESTDEASADDADDDIAMSDEPGDMMLWLDGADVAVDSKAVDAIEVDDLLLGKSTERPEGLLTTDDSWVDGLDDSDVAAVDRMLDAQMKKKKG